MKFYCVFSLISKVVLSFAVISSAGQNLGKSITLCLMQLSTCKIQWPVLPYSLTQVYGNLRDKRFQALSSSGIFQLTPVSWAVPPKQVHGLLINYHRCHRKFTWSLQHLSIGNSTIDGWRSLSNNHRISMLEVLITAILFPVLNGKTKTSKQFRWRSYLAGNVYSC